MFTVDDLNRILATPIGRHGMKDQAPRIECADGFSVSVQASRTHYSDPRSDDGPYTHVECGFAMYPEGKSPIAPLAPDPDADPQAPLASFYARRRAASHLYLVVEEWTEHKDSGEKGGDDVYGYVPVEKVVEWINAHGGVAEQKAA